MTKIAPESGCAHVLASPDRILSGTGIGSFKPAHRGNVYAHNSFRGKVGDKFKALVNPDDPGDHFRVYRESIKPKALGMMFLSLMMAAIPFVHVRRFAKTDRELGQFVI